MKTISQLSHQKGLSSLSVLGFIGWSALMLFVGSLYDAYNHSVPGDVVEPIILKSVKGTVLEQSINPIIRLDRERLSGKNLGEYAPYEPDSGDLVARGYDFFYSKDKNFGVGVWQSKQGKMIYKNLEYDELMIILDGKLVMTDEHGKVAIFRPGEGLVLPKGWSGTLAVPEGGVRKIWISYMGGIKGK